MPGPIGRVLGRNTPRSSATSRGGTPLASSFFADSILLSVICRLRPPLLTWSVAALWPTIRPGKSKASRSAAAPGKPPALSPEQMAQPFDSFDPSRLIDLRDRALIGAMAYNFASVPAAVQLTRANHADSRTTKIYDLRAERIEFVELARVRY